MTQKHAGRVFVVRILLILPLEIQEHGGVFYDLADQSTGEESTTSQQAQPTDTFDII